MYALNSVKTDKSKNLGVMTLKTLLSGDPQDYKQRDSIGFRKKRRRCLLKKFYQAETDKRLMQITGLLTAVKSFLSRTSYCRRERIHRESINEDDETD